MAYVLKPLPPLPDERLTLVGTSQRFDSHRVQLVVKYLADNYSQRLTTDKLSAVINISPSRLSHIFKAQTGVSPIQYLKLLRLDRASELLQTTCMSVKEVMVSVGLSDASHFVRDFCGTYGLTPSQHRAAHFQGLSPNPPKPSEVAPTISLTRKANK
jgi:transcriptional regulator GlxA family with amidase domain